MSLEQQIAALVEAANNLTANVSGKVVQIDAAVQAALATIINMERVYYVDVVNGLDAAAGNEAAPLKSIAAAISRTPVGGAVTIHIKKGQTHDFVGSITRKSVYILQWGVNANAGGVDADSAVLRMRTATGSSTVYLWDSELHVGSYQNGVKVLAEPGDGVAAGLNAIVAWDAGGRPCRGFVSFTHSKIVASNACVAWVNDMALRGCEVDKQPGGMLLDVSYRAGRLDLNGVTLLNGHTVSDVVTGVTKDANGVPRNLLVNAVI